MVGTLDTKTAYIKASTIDNTFNNTDTFPKIVVIPLAGKRIIVHDLVLGVGNTATTSGQNLIITVQAFVNGGWVNIMPMALSPNSAQTLDHDFNGRVQTDVSGGIRLFKMGASNSFTGVVTGTGIVE